jgi:hypothetical protein
MTVSDNQLVILGILLVLGCFITGALFVLAVLPFILILLIFRWIAKRKG